MSTTRLPVVTDSLPRAETNGEIGIRPLSLRHPPEPYDRARKRDTPEEMAKESFRPCY